MIVCFTVPEIWHVTDVIVTFILGYYWPFTPHQQPKKSKFQKNEKNPEDIILHMCTQNYD